MAPRLAALYVVHQGKQLPLCVHLASDSEREAAQVVIVQIAEDRKVTCRYGLISGLRRHCVRRGQPWQQAFVPSKHKKNREQILRFFLVFDKIPV
jgi:hypothetical protein